MSHQQQYDNGIVISNATAFWPHIFVARDYKNNGQFAFDMSAIVSPTDAENIYNRMQALAAAAFNNNEMNLPNFRWPLVTVDQHKKSSIIAPLFPGHGIVSMKAYPDSPPQIVMPGDQQGAYVPIPEAQRSQLVFDGAKCHIVCDLATYENGANIGVRLQFSVLAFWGEGQFLQIGNKPDAATALGEAGITTTMVAPAGFGGQQAAPQQGGFGAPPQQQQQQQGGFGAPPQQQQGGFGQQAAPPQQQGGFGAPPQQQGGFGAPPQQQGGFGAPQQQQQGGFGQQAAPQQQQGGFGQQAAPQQQQGGFGAPPQQQGGFGAPPQQAAPQQGGFGQQQQQGGPPPINFNG